MPFGGGVASCGLLVGKRVGRDSPCDDELLVGGFLGMSDAARRGGARTGACCGTGRLVEGIRCGGLRTGKLSEERLRCGGPRAGKPSDETLLEGFRPRLGDPVGSLPVKVGEVSLSERVFLCVSVLGCCGSSS